MNNKKILNKIGNIFEQTHYYGNVLSSDCTVDSLIRIDENIYNCDNCTVSDTINIAKIMCPLIMKRETRILK